MRQERRRERHSLKVLPLRPPQPLGTSLPCEKPPATPRLLQTTSIGREYTAVEYRIARNLYSFVLSAFAVVPPCFAASSPTMLGDVGQSELYHPTAAQPGVMALACMTVRRRALSGASNKSSSGKFPSAAAHAALLGKRNPLNRVQHHVSSTVGIYVGKHGGPTSKM